jgi:hypothetical protein
MFSSGCPRLYEAPSGFIFLSLTFTEVFSYTKKKVEEPDMLLPEALRNHPSAMNMCVCGKDST